MGNKEVTLAGLGDDGIMLELFLFLEYVIYVLASLFVTLILSFTAKTIRLIVFYSLTCVRGCLMKSSGFG